MLKISRVYTGFYCLSGNLPEILIWANNLKIQQGSQIKILNGLHQGKRPRFLFPLGDWMKKASIESITMYLPEQEKRTREYLSALNPAITSFIIPARKIIKEVRDWVVYHPDDLTLDGMIYVNQPKAQILMWANHQPTMPERDPMAWHLDDERKQNGEPSNMYPKYQEIFERIKGLAERVK